MAKIYSFINAFKNTGKTQSVQRLARQFASYGLKTLLVDLDPFGTLTGIQNLPKPIISWNTQLQNRELIEPRNIDEFTSILPADKSLAMIDLSDQFSQNLGNLEVFLNNQTDFDAILIDCNAAVGELTKFAFSISQIVCIPIVIDSVYVAGMDKTFNLIPADSNKKIITFYPKPFNLPASVEEKRALIDARLQNKVQVTANEALDGEEYITQLGLTDYQSLFMTLIHI